MAKKGDFPTLFDQSPRGREGCGAWTSMSVFAQWFYPRWQDYASGFKSETPHSALDAARALSIAPQLETPERAESVLGELVRGGLAKQDARGLYRGLTVEHAPCWDELRERQHARSETKGNCGAHSPEQVYDNSHVRDRSRGRPRVRDLDRDLDQQQLVPVSPCILNPCPPKPDQEPAPGQPTLPPDKTGGDSTRPVEQVISSGARTTPEVVGEPSRLDAAPQAPKAMGDDPFAPDDVSQEATAYRALTMMDDSLMPASKPKPAQLNTVNQGAQGRPAGTGTDNAPNGPPAAPKAGPVWPPAGCSDRQGRINRDSPMVQVMFRGEKVRHPELNDEVIWNELEKQMHYHKQEAAMNGCRKLYSLGKTEGKDEADSEARLEFDSLVRPESSEAQGEPPGTTTNGCCRGGQCDCLTPCEDCRCTSGDGQDAA